MTTAAYGAVVAAFWLPLLLLPHVGIVVIVIVVIAIAVLVLVADTASNVMVMIIGVARIVVVVG